MSAEIGEKVAEQNVYEKSLPDEAAEKWVRRAFATDRLFAGTRFFKTDVGRGVVGQRVHKNSFWARWGENWVARGWP